MRVFAFVVALSVASCLAYGEDLPVTGLSGLAGIFSSSLFITEDSVASGTYSGGVEGASVNGIGLADVLIVPAFGVSTAVPYCSASSMQMPGSAGFGDGALNAFGDQNVQVQLGTGSNPGGWAEGTLSMSINDPDGNGASFGQVIFGAVGLETQTAGGVPTLWLNGQPAGLITPDSILVTNQYYPIGADFRIFAQANVSTAIPAPSSVISVSFGKVVAAPFPEIGPNGRWENVVRVYVPNEEDPVATITWDSPIIPPNWP